MKLARTARFKKAWNQLSHAERELGGKALRNLARDMRYPALRVERLKGAERVWEARVSRSLRITFQVEGDTILLRNIGRHDETLDRP